MMIIIIMTLLIQVTFMMLRLDLFLTESITRHIILYLKNKKRRMKNTMVLIQNNYLIIDDCQYDK